MPIWTYECDERKCAKIFDKILLQREREDPQPCVNCGGPTHKIMLPSGVNADACNFDPIVVHKNPDGTFYFPGRSDAKVKPGRERVELRNIRQIEAFERTVNKQHERIISRRVEHEQSRYEAVQSQRRARLRHAMNYGFTMKDSDGKTVTFPAFSAAGRRFAEQAIARGDRFSIRPYAPEFATEILHQDASNRAPWRDVDTGWRPVRK